jgi:hypothetical protein
MLAYLIFPKGKEDLFTKMIQTLFVDEGVAGIDQALSTTQDLRERLTLFTASLLTLPIDERLTLLLRDAREYIKDPEHQQIICPCATGSSSRSWAFFKRGRMPERFARIFRSRCWSVSIWGC